LPPPTPPHVANYRDSASNAARRDCSPSPGRAGAASAAYCTLPFIRAVGRRRTTPPPDRSDDR